MERSIAHEPRSPRAAAIAGILYSILMVTVMLLGFGLARAIPADSDSTLLEAWSRIAYLVLFMVPFAGIAFLWFTCVVRDRLRDREDRFFATIFLSSGIILVGLWFVWGAVPGTIMSTRTLTPTRSVDSFVYVFGYTLMNEIIGNYALRMAGVYMTSILSLMLVRMLPVALSMIGTRLSAASLLFMGWFGPRGLGSIVPGLVAAQEVQTAGTSLMGLGLVATVLLSIFVHGLSASPGISLYAQRIARLGADAPEYEAVPAMPTA